MDFVLTFQNLLNFEVEHLSFVATGELIVSAREIWAPASEAAPSGAQAHLKVVKVSLRCLPGLPSCCAHYAPPRTLPFRARTAVALLLACLSRSIAVRGR